MPCDDEVLDNVIETTKRSTTERGSFDFSPEESQVDPHGEMWQFWVEEIPSHVGSVTLRHRPGRDLSSFGLRILQGEIVEKWSKNRLR
jgi:hypothetical protein